MLWRTTMIMWKEFIQIRRDPRLLAVVVVLPLVLLLIYGYAINLDVRMLALAVVDDDRSPASRELVAAFVNNEHFALRARPATVAAAGDLLDQGAVGAVLAIPRDFARDLQRDRAATVQLLVDGSDSTTANTAVGYAKTILQLAAARVTVDAVRRRGIGRDPATMLVISHRPRAFYNGELRSTNFIIPGLIAVILMMLAALLTSMTVVRERERGTIEALVVTPVRPLELMVGKLVPYVVIAYADVFLVVAASQLVFAVPLRGSLALVLVLSGVFLTAALGIGLLISTIAGTQQVAMTAGLMGTQLPSVLLSGFIFPVRSMPPALQWLTNAIPATHFVQILRSIFLKGAPLAQLWTPTLFLVAVGALMLMLSARSFRKKLEPPS